MTIDAILMASGFSTRFGGQNKLLLPVGGVPMARHTLNLACGIPRFGRVFFVCAEPAVAALAEGLPATVLHNDNPAAGQRRSIALGVEASQADGYLFFTCDQPLLDAATVSAILEKAAPGAIVTPTHGGKPGSPVFFAADYRAELLALPPGGHARDIKKRHPERVVSVAIDSPLPLCDADTPDALKYIEDML
ncbi:nucleotidyltransferase family protein [Ruminococcaceae bacterium OttesenSCG-928-D13]|nr:nucleotidyltransferase family protein [Ruminococcaceae bacterium OttesenSCG-928-D13]